MEIIGNLRETIGKQHESRNTTQTKSRVATSLYMWESVKVKEIFTKVFIVRDKEVLIWLDRVQRLTDISSVIR